MSQTELPRNSNYYAQYPFTGLGLLNEDFEFPEDSQGNTTEEVVVPATQTQQPKNLPLTQPQPQPPPPPPILPNENNVPPFLDFPNDPSIINYSPPSTFQPLAPPSISSNSRYLYPPPPTYMHHPYYNPHILADPECFVKIMAEEDKRRRNTAASARFRTKKKMREQALEKNAREMTSKAEKLENVVKELEREIKWLRELLIEKDTRILDIQRSDNNKRKDGDKNGESNDKNDKNQSDQQLQK